MDATVASAFPTKPYNPPVVDYQGKERANWVVKDMMIDSFLLGILTMTQIIYDRIKPPQREGKNGIPFSHWGARVTLP